MDNNVIRIRKIFAMDMKVFVFRGSFMSLGFVNFDTLTKEILTDNNFFTSSFYGGGVDGYVNDFYDIFSKVFEVDNI